MNDNGRSGLQGRRVSALNELARDVSPVRDLWPSIAAAMDAERDARHKTPTRSGPWRLGLGLAASVALVAVGIFLGRSLPSDSGAMTAGTQLPTVTAELLPTAVTDPRHAATRDRLLRDADAKLADLPAQDRERVAASLASIRRSVQEIEAALGREPANALLQELLVNAYQDEMRVLAALAEARQEI